MKGLHFALEHLLENVSEHSLQGHQYQWLALNCRFTTPFEPLSLLSKSINTGDGGMDGLNPRHSSGSHENPQVKPPKAGIVPPKHYDFLNPSEWGIQVNWIFSTNHVET